jgi:hypothetical protein
VPTIVGFCERSIRKVGFTMTSFVANCLARPAALSAMVAVLTSMIICSAEARQSKGRDIEAEKKDLGPLTLVVSIADQSVIVYDGMERIARAPVSTGQRGHETPTGVFSIIQKSRIHFSNLYNEAPMPFMQRITWSGVALHAGPLPGYPASHGCIRLPHGFAKQLYGQTKMGARVIVSRHAIAPTPISHPALFADARPSTMSAERMAQTLLARAGAMHLGGAVEATEATATDAATASTDTPEQGVPTLYREALQRIAAAAERIRAATTARAAATAELGEIARADDRARGELVETKREADKATRALKSVEAEIAKVTSEIDRLVRTTSAGSTDGADRYGGKEDDLEAHMLKLMDDAADAQLQLSLVLADLPELESRYQVAHKRRVETMRQIHEATDILQRAETEDAAAKRDLKRLHLPIHMMISRKKGKLYVRQGYQPLMELAVDIRDPDQIIGTHVFTALAVGTNGISWSAVTVPERAEKDRRRNGRSDRNDLPASDISAARALDRITIPAEVATKLGEILKPGSSLIVSDHGVSQETGRGTDIIVLTR